MVIISTCRRRKLVHSMLYVYMNVTMGDVRIFAIFLRSEIVSVCQKRLFFNKTNFTAIVFQSFIHFFFHREHFWIAGRIFIYIMTTDSISINYKNSVSIPNYIFSFSLCLLLYFICNYVWDVGSFVYFIFFPKNMRCTL